VTSPPDDQNGVAGRSARREYERRRRNRDDRIAERFGSIGLGISRIAGEPGHLRAWKTGAVGEERLAERLLGLLDPAVVELLNDRRIPGRRTNIDHIALGPSGVTVIDAKNYKGKVRVTRSGLLPPRREHLIVGGRDRSKLIDGIERQVETVRDVLVGAGLTHVPLSGALCFVDGAGLPLFGQLRMRDVVVDGPKSIAKLIARVGPLAREDRARIADALREGLPAA
jgi:hypothetical protein